jgi:pyruvate dehydrogenase E2 component (dihydrolipoamide acetyltransferase)
VRAGRAGPAELQGSTFTITNLGPGGIDAFTPIINPPEVALLGAGRVTDRPVPGGPGGQGVAWRQEITLSRTAGHRAVDGTPAARFLATLARCLSELAALT